MKIQRPHSANREPEPSAWQHRQLLDLVKKKVAEQHNVLDYDPVVAMALIANDPAHAPLPALRLKAHQEVARYTHPTLKQVEVAGPGGAPLNPGPSVASEVVGLLEQFVSRRKEE